MAANSLPWHRRYHRDWLLSERRAAMSLAERGLFLELLDRHYIDGSITCDETTLARLTGVPLAEFRRAWKRVEREFQPHPDQPDRLVQAEAAAELADLERYSFQQAEKGKKGGRPKKAPEKLRLSNGKADVKPPESQEDTEVDVEQKTKPLCPPDGERRVLFDAFWNQFPRKIAKRDAMKAYDSSIKTLDDQNRLRDNTPAWVAEFEGREPDKIPYPATFLRKGQWQDPPPKRKPSTTGVSERIKRIAAMA